LRILILALNHAPEPIGAAVYTTGLARELAARGHAVEVVCAEPYYPAWRIFDGYRNRWRSAVEDGVRITRCPLYVPAEPSGAKRVVHHLSFAATALAPTLARAVQMRPDVVFTVAPSLLAAPVAWLAARTTGAKAWLHVQDFEVGAALATGLLDTSSRSARLASAVERTIMRRFDALSTISPAMVGRASGIVPRERIREFRNWADLDPAAAPPGDFRTEWGLGTRTVALYSGNLANKQGVEIIPEAARLLARREDIVFLVCGDGSARASFEAAARSLPNIVLKPLQPREDLARLLATADIHLLPQRADAADLVLPSKLTNMLASGRASVVTAAPGTGLHAEVQGCGLLTPPGDAAAFAAAIAQLADDADLRRGYAAQARRRAAERWDRRAIIDGFERDVLGLVNGR
jgi:colanic acid biosynthesis glycosyl transferase WcaI